MADGNNLSNVAEKAHNSMVNAGSHPGFVSGLAQCRQKHGRKNGDDGDHDEQFDQRER